MQITHGLKSQLRQLRLSHRYNNNYNTNIFTKIPLNTSDKKYNRVNRPQNSYILIFKKKSNTCGTTPSLFC